MARTGTPTGVEDIIPLGVFRGPEAVRALFTETVRRDARLRVHRHPDHRRPRGRRRAMARRGHLHRRRRSRASSPRAAGSSCAAPTASRSTTTGSITPQHRRLRRRGVRARHRHAARRGQRRRAGHARRVQRRHQGSRKASARGARDRPRRVHHRPGGLDAAWAFGIKAFDAFLFTALLTFTAAGVRIALPYVDKILKGLPADARASADRASGSVRAPGSSTSPRSAPSPSRSAAAATSQDSTRAAGHADRLRQRARPRDPGASAGAPRWPARAGRCATPEAAPAGGACAWSRCSSTRPGDDDWDPGTVEAERQARGRRPAPRSPTWARSDRGGVGGLAAGAPTGPACCRSRRLTG